MGILGLYLKRNRKNKNGVFGNVLNPKTHVYSEIIKKPVPTEDIKEVVEEKKEEKIEKPKRIKMK